MGLLSGGDRSQLPFVFFDGSGSEKKPLKETQLRLISWISHSWCCGYFSTPVSVGNEGGGPGESAIVLDELPATHREYWYLDLPDPQSAECGKCEVSTDLNMHKMSEKCSSWKTVPFFFLYVFLSFLRLHCCENVTSFPSFCFVFSTKCVFSLFFSHPFGNVPPFYGI